MSYQSFDELFNAVLTAYENAFKAEGIDVSIAVGDELYRDGAALASLVWGLHREADFVADQIFPTTSSQANLLRHGGLRGLTKADGETFAQFLARLQKRLRNPSSGGNLTDYESWAMDVANGSEVPSAVAGYDGDDAYGPGTIVMVVSVASGAPSAALLAAIKARLLATGCAAPAEIYVIAAPSTSVAVEVSMSGGDVALARSLIVQYIGSLGVGQPLLPDVLRGFAIVAGGSTPVVASPATTVTPSKFGRVVASTVTVAAA